MNLGGTFDLQVDPAEADRLKRARLVRLHTQVIPRLRLLGFILVAGCALLHNAFIYPGLEGFSWPSWFRLAAFGTVFLASDMAMYSVAIYSRAASGEVLHLGRDQHKVGDVSQAMDKGQDRRSRRQIPRRDGLHHGRHLRRVPRLALQRPRIEHRADAHAPGTMRSCP